MCYSVIFASPYTSASPLSLKQNGVFTLVTTSGYTDLHTAHSTHIRNGAGYCLFFVASRVRAVQLRKRACLLQAVAGREEISLRPSDPFLFDS